MISWEAPEPLFALTHLDGRNAHKLTGLRPYFSEFAWMNMRFSVMVDYVGAIYTCIEGKNLSLNKKFSLSDAKTITAIEKIANHDLKAIEEFLAMTLRKNNHDSLVPYINLGIGSEDINSIAFSLLVGECRKAVLLPYLQKIVIALLSLAKSESNTQMVARTHAQAANITTFGKEIANTILRLCDEIEILSKVQFSAKCTGEVGTLQGFNAIDRKKDWLAFTDKFIMKYGLIPSHAATQIAPYDNLVRFLQSLERTNAILIDCVKNIWLYVLVGFVRVTKIESEVGSAGMPHKVNPIYFEGSEGGLQLANGIFETLCRLLPVNRLQRDFSDSTVRRSLSMPMGLTVLSYQSIVEGLKRLAVNREGIASSVERHQEIYIESIKIYCLHHGMADAYNWLKEKTRGKTLNKESLSMLIEELPVGDKRELTELLNVQNPYPQKIVQEAEKRVKHIVSL